MGDAVIKAQYPGVCCFCREPITIGMDFYDKATKKNWHADCFESQPPGPEQFAVASRLGFVSPADEFGVQWTAVCRDGGLLLLSQQDCHRPEQAPIIPAEI